MFSQKLKADMNPSYYPPATQQQRSSQADRYTSGPRDSMSAPGAGYQVPGQSRILQQASLAVSEAFRAVSNGSRNHDRRSTRFPITYDVEWEIPTFMAKNFKNKAPVGKVLVLTGNTESVQGDRVEEYLKNTWQDVGVCLLQAIENILHPNLEPKPRRMANPPFKLLLFERFNTSMDGNATSAFFQIEATQDVHIRVAASLAWLIAAVRFSKYKKFAKSEATIVYTPGSKPSLKLRLARLVEIKTTQFNSCWDCIFKHMVIATDFVPVRIRDPEAQGIALHPHNLCAAGRLEELLSINVGMPNEITVLIGLGTLAWPVKPLKDGSIQWHFYVMKVPELAPRDPAEVLGLIMATTGYRYCGEQEKLMGQMAFVGWLPNAAIRIGASADLAKSVMHSGAEDSPWTTDVRSQSKTISVSVDGYATVGGTVTRTNAILANSNSNMYDDENIRIHARLTTGQWNVSIIYDERWKIAWMVPETTLFLFLAQIWLLQAGIIPSHDAKMAKDMNDRMATWEPGLKEILFIKPGPDTGALAQQAIMKLISDDDLNNKCPKVNGIQETFHQLFSQILNIYSRTQANVANRYDSGARNWIKEGKIVGPNLMQIALRGGSDTLKQADVRKAWAALPATQPTMVLFCKNVGKAIGDARGDLHVRVHCKAKISFNSVPTGQNLLVGTVPSIYYLLRKHTTMDEDGTRRARLSDHIRWEPTDPLFEVHKGPTKCHHVQEIELRKKSTHGAVIKLIEDKEDPSVKYEDKIWNSALIFDDGTYKVPYLPVTIPRPRDNTSHVTKYYERQANNGYIPKEKRTPPQNPVQKFAGKFGEQEQEPLLRYGTAYVVVERAPQAETALKHSITKEGKAQHSTAKENLRRTSSGWDWIGLDWIGLDWIGLDWIGLDWIGLGWVEFRLWFWLVVTVMARDLWSERRLLVPRAGYGAETIDNRAPSLSTYHPRNSSAQALCLSFAYRCKAQCNQYKRISIQDNNGYTHNTTPQHHNTIQQHSTNPAIPHTHPHSPSSIPATSARGPPLSAERSGSSTVPPHFPGRTRPPLLVPALPGPARPTPPSSSSWTSSRIAKPSPPLALLVPRPADSAHSRIASESKAQSLWAIDPQSPRQLHPIASLQPTRHRHRPPTLETSAGRIPEASADNTEEDIDHSPSPSQSDAGSDTHRSYDSV
ncbi:hypothetical protein B7494_g859 [Chlorociboria aeruginascens]|nr:hypothetical protein B7494_g859 [Chlorociboria aeruginascens]